MNYTIGALNAAINEAMKVKDFTFRIGATIFSKNKILASGHNFQQRSTKKALPRYQNWPTSLHAEHHAITKIKDFDDLYNKEIIVVRLNPQNQLRLAKPCPLCLQLLHAAKIKMCHYSTSYNTFESISYKEYLQCPTCPT